ncbi:hypothetical protein [Novosphingobium colocasiae]|uniref:Lipoprotein n=1 Tax=Novosphingobium colocasiae TaxID=1256513 RepID=A0A918PID6_9SPHN|nr:hypothetical protein [Novosphingobium colocasiae]GGZ11918.1 hypothetical protein GCM10011614_28610 [Novosphingobium colocasiae]
MFARSASGRPAQLRILPVLAAALAMTGCAASRDYPSLALRPAERVSGTMTPVPAETAAPAPPASVDASLAGRLSALVDSARAGDRSFATLRADAERAVAAGAGGDEFGRARLNAQVALSHMQVGRSETMAALATLDTLYATARDAQPVADTPDLQAIGAARSEVEEIVRRQDAALDSLAGRLKG